MDRFVEELQFIKADLAFLDGALNGPAENDGSAQMLMARIVGAVERVRIEHNLSLEKPVDGR